MRWPTTSRQQRACPEAQITDRQIEYLFITSIALMFGNMLGNQQVKWIGKKTPEHALNSSPFEA